MTVEIPLDARKIDISTIVVEGRARRDMGDIAELADSMKSLRLINPITVTPKRELIAGGRRLEAAKLLGWKNIPCTVVEDVSDAATLLRLERDENTCRKPMTHSEMLDLARRLEAIEKPKATERMADNARRTTERRVAPGGATRGEEPRSKASHYKVAEVIAPAIGLSQRNYERLRTIDQARHDPDPTVAAVAEEQFTKTDRGETSINAAYETIRKKRKQVKQDATPDPPEKPVGSREAKRIEREQAWWIDTIKRTINSLEGIEGVYAELQRRGVPAALETDEARDIIASLDQFTRATGRIKKSITNHISQ